MIWHDRRKLLGDVFLNLKGKKGNFVEILKTSDFSMLVYTGRQDVGLPFINLVKVVPLAVISGWSSSCICESKLV